MKIIEGGKGLFIAMPSRKLSDRFLLRLNRAVIVGLAVISFALAWRQLVAPNLSVSIFAQLWVYAYFAAAFVPVLFGTFLHDTPKQAVIAAAVTAVVVHFGLYYSGQDWFSYYEGVSVKNPGISTALGITAATVAVAPVGEQRQEVGEVDVAVLVEILGRDKSDVVVREGDDIRYDARHWDPWTVEER